MKRRNFIRNILALPFLGLAAPAVLATLPKAKVLRYGIGPCDMYALEMAKALNRYKAQCIRDAYYGPDKG